MKTLFATFYGLLIQWPFIMIWHFIRDWEIGYMELQDTAWMDAAILSFCTAGLVVAWIIQNPTEVLKQLWYSLGCLALSSLLMYWIAMN